jgi:hypothetical protein
VSRPALEPRHDRAVTLLAGLRRTDERLILSRRDVERLAPAVTEWLESKVPAVVVHDALTSDLPADLRSAAHLIGYRLRALRPVPLPSRPEPAPTATAVPPAARRPDPLQNCDGCDHAVRAPEPGLCRGCRERRTTGAEEARAA